MKLNKLVQNPKTRKLIRECNQGDVVFSEGSSANTVLLVLSGSLRLTRKINGQDCVLANVEAGEFIREKALLQEQTFNRSATATALASTTLLELGPSQFSQLESEAPAIYTLLLKKAFKSLATRNEKMESINQILKSYEPQNRFLTFIHFLAKNGAPTPRGQKFFLDEQSTAQQLNCTLSEVREWVQSLVTSNFLTPEKEGWFLASDENALLNSETIHLEAIKAA